MFREEDMSYEIGDILIDYEFSMKSVICSITKGNTEIENSVNMYTLMIIEDEYNVWNQDIFGKYFSFAEKGLKQFTKIGNSRLIALLYGE